MEEKLKVDPTQYEYKFLTDDMVAVSKTINLAPVLVEIQKCLESEGVYITPRTFIKCVDVYLRVIGFCRISEDNDLPPISVITGVISFNNDSNMENAEHIDLYKNLIDMINEYVEDYYKISSVEVEQIKNNIPTVFKEVVIFLNDVVNRILDEFSSSNTYTVAAQYQLNEFDNFYVRVAMDKVVGREDKIIELYFESSALVSGADSAPCGVIVGTFPEDIRNAMMNQIEEMNKKDTKEGNNA